MQIWTETFSQEGVPKTVFSIEPEAGSPAHLASCNLNRIEYLKQPKKKANAEYIDFEIDFWGDKFYSLI